MRRKGRLSRQGPKPNRFNRFESVGPRGEKKTPRKCWLIITTYIYSSVFFENWINLGSVLQCDQHVVDECFHMWDISSSSFTSHLFAVELYSYIYSFMRCYIHFHTCSMEVLTQVTGVDRRRPCQGPPHRNAMSSTPEALHRPDFRFRSRKVARSGEASVDNESVMTQLTMHLTLNIHQEMLKYL